MDFDPIAVIKYVESTIRGVSPIIAVASKHIINDDSEETNLENEQLIYLHRKPLEFDNLEKWHYTSQTNILN